MKYNKKKIDRIKCKRCGKKFLRFKWETTDNCGDCITILLTEDEEREDKAFKKYYNKKLILPILPSELKKELDKKDENYE